MLQVLCTETEGKNMMNTKLLLAECKKRKGVKLYLYQQAKKKEKMMGGR
jgi:hypothetical protein